MLNGRVLEKHCNLSDGKKLRGIIQKGDLVNALATLAEIFTCGAI